MTIKVLIADDHRILREGLNNLLENENDISVVGEATNGREAVALAGELKPDVVIMDISMPDLNGIEATRRLVYSGTGIRVLALSMYSDSRFVKQMIEAGASGYLLKDSAFGELVTAIRSVAADRIYISPGASSPVVQEFVLGRSGGKPIVPPLTSLEQEVLQLTAEGKSIPDIARHMRLSAAMVEIHRQHLMDKLGLHSIAELTKYAVREGITDLET